MTKIRYKNLTREQKEFICNGCGGKGSIKAPKWLFKASCNHHDFNYWVGFSEYDRKKADSQFLNEMMKDVAESKLYLKPLRWFEAKLFYFLVRRLGKTFFHYGYWERSLEDLQLLIFEAYPLKKPTNNIPWI